MPRPTVHPETLVLHAGYRGDPNTGTGAVAVPIVSVLFGHSVLILGAAVLYLIAWPAFFYLLKPIPGAKPA